MFAMIHRMLVFCGRKHAAKIRTAYLFSLLNAMCKNAPFMVAFILIRKITENNLTLFDSFIAAGILVIFLTAGAFLQNASDRFQSATGFKVFAEKRMAFAAHLRKLPMGYFTAGNIGKISSILSEDMVFIEENSMSIIAEVVSFVLSQAILTAFIFFIHPYLGLIMLSIELISAIISIGMTKESIRNSAARQQSVEDLTSAVLEYIEGLAVSKSFGITGESASALHEGFAKSRIANLNFEKQHSPWTKTLELLFAAGIGLVLFASIFLYQNDMLETYQLIGLMLFLTCLFTPIKNMFHLGARLTIMDNCLDRLDEVFGEKELADAEENNLHRQFEQGIEFDNVSFSYDEETILKNISFTVNKGEMLALVGKSGSGKTTIANLMARFWDVNEGSIRIDGTDIREIPLDNLMSRISMVFQNVYLFDDTVYNNIAMGRPDASYEEVVEAAKKARCYDFIMALPYGFDTYVGEGGASLSGGEAQRISIARCILKDAPIIILDEATASVDADNEYHIRLAMSELCRDKTVIIIAHKLHTIRNAEKILVLEHGRIVEQGDHESLMDQKGIYYNMTTVQQLMNGFIREVQ